MLVNYYMHLIDGKPAAYVPNKQIVFVNKYSRGLLTFDQMFVRSLATIRSQQRRSEAWRLKNGATKDLPAKYGYLRIKMPGNFMTVRSH